MGLKIKKHILKNTKKILAVLLVITVLPAVVSCGKKTEAVITDEGADITEEAQQHPTLAQSSSAKFSYDDLTVNSIKYLMTEDEVRRICGEPVTVYESEEQGATNEKTVYSEKVYSYNDLTLVFMRINDDKKAVGDGEPAGEYRLSAAASISDKDVFSRGIQVGDTVDDLLAVYYRDSNYLNHYYKSDDETAVIGKFLYGSFTTDELEKVSTKDAISYGLVNFNGAVSEEMAQNYIIEMTYFAPDYMSGTASISDDFAQIAFDIDKDGKITAIRWYFYPEEE